MSDAESNVSSDSLQRLILAGCHSLVHLPETPDGKNEPIGDPLDQAALAFTGWRYDPSSSSYFRPESACEGTAEPVRLWQIKSLPFDPTRRLSSAVVLVQLEDGSLQLMKLTKGSPETMKGLFKRDGHDFDSAFEERTQELETLGYRCIAMGADNVSNSTIRSILFTEELSTDGESLITAKSRGDGLHRNEIEGHSDDQASGLTFCGFCCFDASLRPSSKRVVNELNRGGINTVMLTGDSLDAAMCVARKVNVIRHKNIAVLETRPDAETGEETLVWKLMRTDLDEGGSFRILRNHTTFEPATLATSAKLVKRHKRGRLALAASGSALEVVLNGYQNDVHRLIGRNLAGMAVIARATPDLKKTVIDSLKYVCGCQVMMCGT
jgi:magnesium-transporting ATPase (P-type)